LPAQILSAGKKVPSVAAGVKSIDNMRRSGKISKFSPDFEFYIFLAFFISSVNQANWLFPKGASKEAEFKRRSLNHGKNNVQDTGAEGNLHWRAFRWDGSSGFGGAFLRQSHDCTHCGRFPNPESQRLSYCYGKR